MLQVHGNEVVNSRYLGKYDVSSSRMKMPRDNSDLNRLRTWIASKYVDRVWYMDGGDNNTTVVAPPKRDVQTAPPGRRKVIRDEQPQQEQQDLFGGGSWDAFASNEIANHTTTFDADFSNATVANDAAFQVDFGIQQQEPTKVNMPQEQKSDTDFAAFGCFNESNAMNLQKDVNSTNFDMTNQIAPNAHVQPQQMQPSFRANFEQANEAGPRKQQNMFDANFDRANQTASNAQILMQQTEPSFQANFDQVNAVSQQPQQNMFGDNFDQSNQTTQHVQSRQQQMQPEFHANSFDQSSQVTGQKLQQHISSANFNQLNQTHIQSQQHNTISTNSDQPIQAVSMINLQQQSMPFNANFEKLNQAASEMLNGPQNVAFDAGVDKVPVLENKHLNNVMPGNTAVTTNDMNYSANIHQNNTQMKPKIDTFANFENVIASNMPNEEQNVSIALSQFHGVSNISATNNNTTTLSAVMNQPYADIGNANGANEMVADQTLETSNISHDVKQPIAANPNAFGVTSEDYNTAFDAFEGLSLEPTPDLMGSDTCTNHAHPPVPGGGVDKSTKVQEIVIMLDNLSLNQLLQVHQFITSLSYPNNEAKTKNKPLAVSAAEVNTVAVGIPTQQKNMNVGVVDHNSEVPMQQFKPCSDSGMSQMHHIAMGSSTSSNINSGGAASSNDQSNNAQMGMSGTSVFNPTMTADYQGAMNLNIQHPLHQPVSEMNQVVVTGMSSNIQKDLSEMQSSNSLLSETQLPPVEKEGNPFDMY